MSVIPFIVAIFGLITIVLSVMIVRLTDKYHELMHDIGVQKTILGHLRHNLATFKEEVRLMFSKPRRRERKMRIKKEDNE